MSIFFFKMKSLTSIKIKLLFVIIGHLKTNDVQDKERLQISQFVFSNKGAFSMLLDLRLLIVRRLFLLRQCLDDVETITKPKKVDKIELFLYL